MSTQADAFQGITYPNLLLDSLLLLLIFLARKKETKENFRVLLGAQAKDRRSSGATQK